MFFQNLLEKFDNMVSYKPVTIQPKLKKDSKLMKVSEMAQVCVLLSLTDIVEDVPTKDVPFRRWGNHTFPEKMIFLSKFAYFRQNKDGTMSDDIMYYQLRYWNIEKNCAGVTCISVDHEFEEIDEPEILEEHLQRILKNLNAELAYGGTIGSDPEIFVSAEGKILNAFDFLGSKTTPTRGKNHNNQDIPNKAYWDGFQAEFDTVAGSCLAYHCDSVRDGLFVLDQAAKKHNPKARLDIRTTVDVDLEVLQSGKEEHVEFGCMPSFNIYGMKGLQMSGREVPFRSAGGHIHFGIGRQSHESVVPMVEALDAILGVACVSLFEGMDDPRRRTMYGMAGEYRLPPHGLEYRTLSNAWLAHPMLMHIVFDLSRKALTFGRMGLLKYWKGDRAETIEIINTCDVKRAREVLVRNKDLFIRIINSRYQNQTMADLCYKVFMGGALTFVKDPTDFTNNWQLATYQSWHTHSGNTDKCFANALTTIQKGNKVS